MEENTATIDLPVREDYFPNAYVTATLVRPAAEITEHLPARAFGMTPIMLSKAKRQLEMTVNTPSAIQPRRTIAVDIQLDKPVIADMTVALVDEGILQITGFKTPNPLNFFYGKRRPHLRAYDMYSFVYPETEAAASHMSPAGGMFDASRKRHLNPISARRVKSVALWSGIVRTDQTGHAAVDVEIPEFNGQLTVLVVAASDNAFGSARTSLKVRDNIVLLESFPRFVAPGDTVKAPVMVYNHTGKETAIDVALELRGPATVKEPAQTITAPNNAERVVRFDVTAGAVPGKVECTVRAKSAADGAYITLELANRPPQPLRTEHGSASVMADSVFTVTMPGDWIPGTDKYILRTSSLAAVTLSRDIQRLLSYPYGCIEQSTSRLFPLLYFDDLARFVQPSLFGGKGPDYFVQEGIGRLQSMQQNDGSFSYWPGGNSVHLWSSIYATHFLVEARKAGYEVEEETYKKALDKVKRAARNQLNSGALETPERVYAIYVMAKAGKVDNRMLNFLREINPSEVPAFTIYQAAGALVIGGDIEFARTLIPEDIQPAVFEPETGGTFSSGVRTNAILLDVLLDIDRTSPSAHALAQDLMKQARLNRWYTTQSTAFALMALGKYFRGQQPAKFTGTLEIVGDTSYSIDTSALKVERDNLAGKEVRVSIDGQGAVLCFLAGQRGQQRPGDRGVRQRHPHPAGVSRRVRRPCGYQGSATGRASDLPHHGAVASRTAAQCGDQRSSPGLLRDRKPASVHDTCTGVDRHQSPGRGLSGYPR